MYFPNIMHLRNMTLIFKTVLTLRYIHKESTYCTNTKGYHLGSLLSLISSCSPCIKATQCQLLIFQPVLKKVKSISQIWSARALPTAILSLRCSFFYSMGLFVCLFILNIYNYFYWICLTITSGIILTYTVNK